MASMSDTEVDVFVGLGRKGKSKGKGKRTSGKGFGRKRNPIGRDGTVMSCNTCGSEFHFANNCDGSGPRGQGAHHSQHVGLAFASGDGPLGNLSVPSDSTPVLMMSASDSQNTQSHDHSDGAGWTVPPATQMPVDPPEPAQAPDPYNPWANWRPPDFAFDGQSTVRYCVRCGVRVEDGEYRCWRCAYRPGEEHTTASEPRPTNFSRPPSEFSAPASEPAPTRPV